MQTTLQPVLVGGEGLDTDISVFLNQVDNQYDVYLGVALLERVGADAEELSQKLLIARCYNAGSSLRHLAKVFGRCPRTIKRWGEALKSGDLDKMAEVFAGRRGGRKLTPELVRYAQQLYRERSRLGQNYRQIIIGKIDEVFQVEISPTLASEIFALAKEPDNTPDSGAVRVTTEQNGADSSTEPAAPVQQSPAPLPVQLHHDTTHREELVHHAGQVIFAAEMKHFDVPLHRQIIAQILQGAVNLEQTKTVCAPSLANFAAPIMASRCQQWQWIDKHADLDNTMEIYRRNALLLSDGPNRGDVFYFDPHTKEYTGKLRILKNWCGRRHGIAPIINLDSFHTRSGRPCYIAHYSAYYDMRERFFMSLAQFDLLFEDGKRSGRTFVIDRGIYGLETIRAFTVDHLITWEKGYKDDGWRDDAPTIDFVKTRDKNRHNDKNKRYRFSCQQQQWRRDSSVRQIVVRVSRNEEEPIEVSVLATNPHMAVEDVVWLIFRRWIQENDFKNLDCHFGINQLTSRDSSTFAARHDHLEDRPVDSPEYKELKATLRGLDGDLGKQLVKRRKLQKANQQLRTAATVQAGRIATLQAEVEEVLAKLRVNLEPSRKSRDVLQRAAACRKQRQQTLDQISRNDKSLSKLETQINQIECQIEPLEGLLGRAIRKKSRLELLIKGNFSYLDTRKKALFDALRVTASNIFRNVQERFRPIYNNYRDDHVLVRTLSRSSGKIRTTAKDVHIEIWLPGRFQDHQLRAFGHLLDDIQQQINYEVSAGKTLHLGLVAGPLSV